MVGESSLRDEMGIYLVERLLLDVHARRTRKSATAAQLRCISQSPLLVLMNPWTGCWIVFGGSQWPLAVTLLGYADRVTST